MSIRLEAGKKYRDRRGEVYGPMMRVSNGCFQCEGQRWYENGTFSDSKIDHPLDLIAEVIETAQEPVKNQHKHAELIKAWADGAYIEEMYTSLDDGEWYYFSGDWDCLDKEFRIKPETKPDLTTYHIKNFDEFCLRSLNTANVEWTDQNANPVRPQLKVIWDSEGNLKDAEVLQ